MYQSLIDTDIYSKASQTAGCLVDLVVKLAVAYFTLHFFVMAQIGMKFRQKTSISVLC